jgi:hypothetical protein
MATTTNYSWSTPDDTALVKDGAAAIRTLGSSIDTTTKNLNPSTTLGDIEYRSSTANTNTRLGIGTTGQVLTVVGGVPSWASAGAGFKGVSLWQTTDISLANDTTVALTWDSENFDTDAFHSTSTNTGRITIPSGLNGKYHINGAISFVGGGAGFRRVDVLKNGTVFIYGGNIASASASGGTQIIPFSVLLDLVATDYVSISVSQASGGTISTLGGQAFGQFNATFLGA